VYADLRGSDVAFVIVTSPLPQAVAEAVFFSRKLGEYGIRPLAVVVNRVHAPLSGDALAQIGQLRPLVAAGAAGEALLASIAQAAKDHGALAERDREGERRLREHVGASMSYTEVPAFAEDVHDLGALARVGTCLLGPLAA